MSILTKNGSVLLLNGNPINSPAGEDGPIQINLQTKNVTPTETAQSVTADSGFDGLELVNVAAISSTYIGSEIPQRSSLDLVVSGNTITAAAGYYSTAASKSVTLMTLPTSTNSSALSGYASKLTINRSTSDQYINIPTGYNDTASYYKISAVANGSVTVPNTISGTSATVTIGTNKITLSKTLSLTPNVTAAGYINQGTAGNSDISLEATITTKAAATYYPSTSDQTVAANQYLTGAQTIKAVVVSGLDASKILSGTTVNIGDSADADRITSVTGNVTFKTYYKGSGAPSSSLGSVGDIYLQLS